MEPPEVVIKVRDGGPLKVTGRVRLVDAEGNAIAVPDGPIALCRCGRSREKPFCDRSHRDVEAGGARAAGDAQETLAKAAEAAPAAGDAEATMKGRLS